jgi:RNA polymerase sigma factor (TIGR02999 family)
MTGDQDVADLMAELRRGNPAAAGRLVERFYPELKRLAAFNMDREKPGHTWQATVLVNELYLELCRIKELKSNTPRTAEEERRAFFGLAAHIMRRLLIAHARPVRKRVAVTGESALDELPDGDAAWRELGDLLTSLETIDPRLRQVVELKVFEGLNVEQIAERTGCSPRTVARQWHFARTWLEKALGDGPDAHT